MRRPQGAKVEQGRGGCQGAMLGLLAGMVAGALLFRTFNTSEVVALLTGVMGMFIGAQIGQRLARRRRRR